MVVRRLSLFGVSTKQEYHLCFVCQQVNLLIEYKLLKSQTMRVFSLKPCISQSYIKMGRAGNPDEPIPITVRHKLTRLVVFESRACTVLTLFFGIPFNDRHCHRPSRSTKSNAALRSRNLTMVGRRKLCLCFRTFQRVNISSIHLRLSLKSTCFSRVRSS